MDFTDKWLKYVSSEQDDNEIEIYRIWEKNNILSEIIKDLIQLISHIKYDKIAAIETSGIIFAAPLADHFKKGLIVLHKKNKMPDRDKLSKEFINWKNEPSRLEIDIKGIEKNQKILVVDDLVQTANSLQCAKELIENSKNSVAAFLCVANISKYEKIDETKIYSLIRKH